VDKCFSIVFVVFLVRILLVELCGVLVQVEGGEALQIS
jgi:hypothetical protein